MEKRDLGVHVAKVRETSVSCLILLHLLYTLTLPECNEFHKKKITSYDINKFTPSPAKPLSFENDGDGVRIHQRRTSYKLIFLEINKVNKYRRFFSIITARYHRLAIFYPAVDTKNNTVISQTNHLQYVHAMCGIQEV